jgi:hypothetical protein
MAVARMLECNEKRILGPKRSDKKAASSAQRLEISAVSFSFIAGHGIYTCMKTVMLDMALTRNNEKPLEVGQYAALAYNEFWRVRLVTIERFGLRR